MSTKPTVHWILHNLISRLCYVLGDASAATKSVKPVYRTLAAGTPRLVTSSHSLLATRSTAQPTSTSQTANPATDFSSTIGRMASGFDELQLNSNCGAGDQAVISSQAPAASGSVSYSRQMDFAPQNVRARNWLKDRDDTFRDLDDLREQVRSPTSSGSYLAHQVVPRAGILQKRTYTSRRCATKLVGKPSVSYMTSNSCKSARNYA